LSTSRSISVPVQRGHGRRYLDTDGRGHAVLGQILNEMLTSSSVGKTDSGTGYHAAGVKEEQKKMQCTQYTNIVFHVRAEQTTPASRCHPYTLAHLFG